MANESKYQYRPKIWTPEIKQWLIDNTKGMKRQEAYELFCKTFPEVKTTLTGISNERSRLRCAEYTCSHPSTKQKPLYAEHIKKGYVFVKVAQPSVWWSKARFVYVATHPEEAGELLETDSFYFLDGNNRNFDWQNIVLVHRKEQCLFMAEGGIVPGHPDETRLNLLRARLKLAQLDAGERAGLVVKHGNSRFFREELNRKTRERLKKKYHSDEEFRTRSRQYVKKYKRNMTTEQKERLRTYQREWARKKREKCYTEMEQNKKELSAAKN